jgi:hypothetical protein
MLSEATPAETRYEIRLVCRLSASTQIRGLLVSTLASLPLRLKSVFGEQADERTANEKLPITFCMRATILALLMAGFSVIV